MSSAGLAQSKPANRGRALAEGLTTKLMSLQNLYQSTSPASKAQVLTQFRAVAAQRQKVLSNLMETDPGAVIRVSVPADVRRGMPVSVQMFVEQRVRQQGRLEVAFEDNNQGGKLHHFLEIGGQRLELHFAQNQPRNLLTGAIVRVQGVQVGQGLALSSGTSTSSFQVVSGAAMPSISGAQNTLVILVNFSNNATQPYTPTAAYNVMFGSGKSVSNFDLENSYGQVSLSGDVVGWYTLPIASTCSQSTIATYANQAASAAGVNLGAYGRYIYAYPSAGCSYWGYSFIGGTQSWVTGPYEVEVVAHEMGHQFGLYHSHALDCSPNIVTGTCNSIEYGDQFDAMGDVPSYFPAPHFNPFQKERLGWLNAGSSPPIQTVQSNGTYTIGPYEAQDGSSKALKILKSTSNGINTWYYVEYREAQGFDSFLSNYPNVTNGVLIRTGTDSSPSSSSALDMTPATSSWLDPALDTGLTFTDPSTGTSISTVGVNSSGATVAVTLGSGGTQTCTRANPTISLSPAQSAWVTAGTTVSFGITVKDNDSSGCSSSTFSVAGSGPSGWSVAVGTSSLTLSPGSSASTTLRVTSPTGTANGFYTVGARTTNTSAAASTASGAATYVIGTAPSTTITVKTNQSSYSFGQTVSVTVTVTAGSPVSGANVSVTITKSNGSLVSLSGTTGSNGVAVVSYKLKRKDPAGTYSVRATTSGTGNAPTAGATTSFTVH